MCVIVCVHDCDCVCTCVCVCVGGAYIGHTWRSEDKFSEAGSVFSPYQARSLLLLPRAVFSKLLDKSPVHLSSCHRSPRIPGAQHHIWLWPGFWRLTLVIGLC